jgi:hypothetical protein
MIKKIILFLLIMISFISCNNNPTINSKNSPFIITQIKSGKIPNSSFVKYVSHDNYDDVYLWAPSGIGNIGDTLVIINMTTYRKYENYDEK